MKQKFFTLGMLVIFLWGCNTTVDNEWEILSPDGKLRTTIHLDDEGRLSYRLFNDNKVVIGKSPLGMIFEEATFDDGLSMISEEIYPNRREAYTLLSGKKLENNIAWNEKIFTVKNPDGQVMSISFRLYDDGLAFSYEFEEPDGLQYTIKEELTGFKVPANSLAWMHPYDTIAPWAPAYETFYKDEIPVGTPSPDNKNGWAFPMLFKSGEFWTLITSAGMPENYPGMYVDGNPENNIYKLILPLSEEAMGLCSSNAKVTLPFKTPWRVLITDTNPGTIVESNRVHDLGEVSVLTDTAWIEPGKASWSWWSESDSPRNYFRLREYVDFTAEMGWEYFLVDANWNTMFGGNLERLAEYAEEKGVGLLIWYNSGGPHNEITEQPRDLMHQREQRREEFARIQEMGIKGIKVDFFQSDKACIMQLYHDILKDAADFELLVNFHGSTIPRGWERTYPNLMTMESVRGAEAYKFDSSYPEKAPWHNTILPFTRNVLGPMDYTPVTFSDVDYPKLTTHAHELALAVVFESGIQHFADSRESYLSQPEYVIDYLRNVPVVWDDTRFIDGFPGDFVIIARRSGDKWYISGINGTNEEMEKTIDPGFLSSGTFDLFLISDGEQQDEFNYSTNTITSSGEIKITMQPRGGFAAILSKK